MGEQGLLKLLGYQSPAREGWGSGNSRNGKRKKRVQSEVGAFEIVEHTI